MSPYKKEDDSAGLLVLGVAGGAVALVLWLAGRNGNDGGGDPPPVVNVGPDQTVDQDAEGNASVVINYTVTGANPVTLAWTGSPGVTITPVVAGQVIAGFTAAGVYSIKLTATDSVTGKIGFDELVVTVVAIEQRAILVAGRLAIVGDKVSEFRAIRVPGEPITLTWPCQNVGQASGTALIIVAEGTQPIWAGPPLPVAPNQTVSLGLTHAVDLAGGVHNLTVQMFEQRPDAVLNLISTQAIVIEVVDPANLAVVGLPVINGVEGPAVLTVPLNLPLSIQWLVENTGGDTGICRLRGRASPFLSGVHSVDGPLTSIPGHDVVGLLIGMNSGAGVKTYTITVTVEDQFAIILGTFPFILNVINF
ncbi:MAG: hypothetical protein U1B30_15705 [Pseudomonadota bacterium]|nr:hypothetical protein [Pseudomonadota bacterium]